MAVGTNSPLSGVRALAFDVLGTVVDWRASVTEELVLRAHRKLSADLAPDLKFRLERLEPDDWARFAQAWRDSYLAFTQSFDPERDPWKTVDDHHRDSLVDLLRRWELDGLYSHADIDSLSLVWHRLSPWPDSSDGLRALASLPNLTTAALSNGNIALLRDFDDFGSLGFQTLLSAETFGAYKPNPAAYFGAVRDLGLEPSQVAMVAAHLGDLQAARSCGLRTIYVERPREEEWGREEEEYRQAWGWVDLWISEQEHGFLSLAHRLQYLF